MIEAEFLKFLGMLLQNRLDALHREQAKEREETENKIKGLVNEVRRNLVVVFAVEKGVFQCRRNLRLVIWSRCKCRRINMCWFSLFLFLKVFLFWFLVGELEQSLE